MKKSIERFCETCENGLFLIDMPTGFGKTHHVLEFIADNFDNPKYHNKNFFFLTTLKKNLPYKKLRECFQERGKEEQFEKLSIYINSNADTVIDNLEYLYMDGKIPEHIMVKPEFKELFNSVQWIKLYKKKRENASEKDDLDSILCKGIEQAIQRQERVFRYMIEKELFAFHTPSEKLKAIQNNPDYEWIGKLYPSVFSKEKRIFFMSVDKFILGNSTIIEPTYSFCHSAMIDKAIIFIDEFDSTKDRILNQIIRRGLDNHIDYLPLFLQIHASLKTRAFPTDLLTDSKQQMQYLEKNFSAKKCAEIIEMFEQIFDETYHHFHMEYSFRTMYSEQNKRNFIFSDLQFHSIFSGESSFIKIDTDKKAKQNWLSFIKNKTKEAELDVLGLLASVKGCIAYYQKGCKLLSNNYTQLQNERKKEKEDDFTFENAVASVLREFHLSEEYRKYLIPMILSERKQVKKDKKVNKQTLVLEDFEKSLYDRGFRYYDLIDNPNHNMQSEIHLYDFQDTPEHILLQIAEKAKVIGISATATMDTVIGNYDLEYLQKMLQQDFYILPEEDKKRLHQEFFDFIKDYDKVNICVEPVAYNDNFAEELKEIFCNPILIQRYTEKLEMIFYGSNRYAASNFMRIVKVLKSFLLNDNIQSFLCLSNKLAKEQKESFDLSLLREFASDIIKEHHLSLNAKNVLYTIDSEDYENKHKNMLKRLSEGEKLFVLSSYYTIGAGQNIQYKKPENSSVVQVNNYVRKEMEKDFDGIYLERPTNLIVNIDSEKSIEITDIIRFVFQIEFLMEQGELSRKDGIACIKEAFSYSSGGNFYFRNKKMLYDTLSVHNFAIRILIQAVGRICRTGLKNETIYIFVDDSILKKYDLSKVEDRLLNPEFAEIVKFGKQFYIPKNEVERKLSRLEHIAGKVSLETMQGILKLKSNFTVNNIEKWKHLREWCLKYPTISEEEIYQTRLKLIYLEAPKPINAYSYEQEGDYQKSITIKFDMSLSQKMSETEVKLEELFHIPKLREYFEMKQYATGFKVNKYLLTPPMFNNIYKGALGEEVGKFILENYFFVQLKEIHQPYFEFFDYVIGNDIYIDFKLWKPTMNINAEEEKKKILEKLNTCNGKRAIIINIMYDREAYPIESSDKKIIEIPYLYRTDTHKLDTDMIQKIWKEGYLR